MTTWANEEDFYRDLYYISDFKIPENTVKAKSLNKAEHTLYWYEVDESDDEITSKGHENSKDSYHENMESVTEQIDSVVGNFYNNEALESYLKSLQFEEQQAQTFLPSSLEEATTSQQSDQKTYKSIAQNLQDSFKNFFIAEPPTEQDINGYSSGSSVTMNQHASTSLEQSSISSPEGKQIIKKKGKQRKYKKSAPKQNDDTFQYRDRFNALDKNDFPAL